MLRTMKTRFFRAGVGTVIYNQHGQVALFKRNQAPVGVWQFQQGGIDTGEFPSETLWRELKEEVGLSEKDVTVTAEFPYWLPYEDVISATDASAPRIGQIHRWYFLRLKDTVTIDLANATDDEFSDFCWASFAAAIAQTSDHKKFVYEALKAYFDHSIQKTLA